MNKSACRSGLEVVSRLLIVGLAIVSNTGCVAPSGHSTPMTSIGVERQVYTLGPGDRVRVVIFQHRDLSGDFGIDSTGRIALPLIGGVVAEGLTLVQLEQKIAERLKPDYISDPRVNVDLTKTRSFCVLGEVNKPGCFDYIYFMRGSKAIAAAGGYTYRAKKYHLNITREDGTKVVGTHDDPIFPGDVIEVPERFF